MFANVDLAHVREVITCFPKDIAGLVIGYAFIPKMLAKEVAWRGADDLIGWVDPTKRYKVAYEVARNGRGDLVRKILTIWGELRRAAIFGACRGGHLDILREFELTIGEVSCAASHGLRGGCIKVIEYLSTEYSYVLHKSDTLLGYACEGGNWKLITRTGYGSYGISMEQAIVGAAKGGHFGILKAILSKHQPAGLDRIAMRSAVKRGSYSIVRLLAGYCHDSEELRKLWRMAQERGYSEIVAVLKHQYDEVLDLELDD